MRSFLHGYTNASTIDIEVPMSLAPPERSLKESIPMQQNDKARDWPHEHPPVRGRHDLPRFSPMETTAWKRLPGGGTRESQR